MSRKSKRMRAPLPAGIYLATLLLILWPGAVVAYGSLSHRLISSPRHRAGTQPTPKQLRCLPKDVGTDDIVEHEPGSKTKVTVGRKLGAMNARCHKGKLLDRKGREIRFFHISCWGNPPPDYLEIQRREQAELAKLKQRYTMIVLGCDPLIQ